MGTETHDEDDTPGNWTGKCNAGVLNSGNFKFLDLLVEVQKGYI